MRELLNQIEAMKEEAKLNVVKAENSKELDEMRIKFLGKNGRVTGVLKQIGTLEHEDRKAMGLAANKLKEDIEHIIQERNEKLQSAKERASYDITLPGKVFESGSRHPITIVQKEIEELFKKMGFMIADTPEVETEYYNFKTLNVPKHHPARDMQDTYWLDNGMVLRTQTSAGQVRLMEKIKPPIRVIIPGRCFRNEEIDASHENTFFQLEGMVVDRGISVANLLYTMRILLSNVFKKDIEIRLRPGYFPFVEPGFEMDIKCLICSGKGCSTCKHSGWVELMPCGMIHPNVLKHGGIDSEEYTGFAFGLGLTRLAMMKYGIPDIRVFNSGNLKSLKQFVQEG
ncbi:MAG: phenylalanine--tRNA ligase subunit alpha [Bacillota bacterium]